MLSLLAASTTTCGHRRRSRSRSYQPRRRVSSNRAQAKPSTVKGETARAQGAKHPSTCERGQQASGELETKTNRDTGEAWLFQYDALGNLLTVGLPNGDLVEYLVDGLGRRVGKKKNGVLLRQWLYRDALKPVAELDGSGVLVSEFVYGAKGNVPDYVRRGGATYRVISDHLGSPRYVVNVANSADVPFTASYTSFGEVTGTGPDWMPFGFAGGIRDGDTNVVRFGKRDYDPAIGRWLNREPLKFVVGTNLYEYVGNDPIDWVDPTGAAPDPAGAGGATGEGGCEGAGGGPPSGPPKPRRPPGKFEKGLDMACVTGTATFCARFCGGRFPIPEEAELCRLTCFGVLSALCPPYPDDSGNGGGKCEGNPECI